MTGCAGTAAVPPGASALVTLNDGGEFAVTERTDEFSIVEVRKAPPGSRSPIPLSPGQLGTETSP